MATEKLVANAEDAEELGDALFGGAKKRRQETKSEAEPPQVEFSLSGVRASFLLHFIEQHGGRAAFANKTTTMVNDEFVQPHTLSLQVSYCEWLRKNGREEDTGDATWFISHAWRYNFVDVVDAILDHLPPSTVVWFDLFSNSQHNTAAKPFAWWTGTFMNAIKTMGNVLMITLPWNSPLTLTRCWCVFEIYAAVLTQSRFEVGMGREEKERFLDGIRREPAIYYRMLASVKSSNAAAFKEDDKVAIFEVVKAQVGFAGLDSMVLRALESWMHDELRRQIASCHSAADEAGESQWKSVLGQALSEAGKFDAALPLFEESLAINTRLRGLDDEASLCSKLSLAQVLQKLGRFSEAQAEYEQCLEWRSKLLGDDHRDTILTAMNLAHVLQKTGDFAKAEPLYMGGIAKMKAQLASTDADLLIWLNNFALMYSNMGTHAKALPLIAEVFGLMKDSLGPDHPDTLSTMTNLASIYDYLAQPEQALPLIQDCVERKQRVLGPEHPNTLNSINHLGACLRDLGRLSEGRAAGETAVGTAARVLGGDHPQTLRFTDNLAFTILKQGDQAEAQRRFALILPTMDRVLGSGHAFTKRARERQTLAANVPPS